MADSSPNTKDMLVELNDSIRLIKTIKTVKFCCDVTFNICDFEVCLVPPQGQKQNMQSLEL